MFDLVPAATRMSALVSAVRADELDDPTPCPDWTVAQLLAHVHEFATVFAANARKDTPRPPAGLVANWRSAVPVQLEEMADAWRAETAWRGEVSAGGVDMRAADNAVVAIEELVVHGWDLARATDQDFAVDDAELDHVDAFFGLFGERIAAGEGPFGPRASVGPDASRLERIIARTGRDPSWAPSR